MSVTDTRDAEPVLVALSEDLDGGFVELFGAYRRLVFSVAVRVYWLVTILLNVWRNHTRAAARRPAAVESTGARRIIGYMNLIAIVLGILATLVVILTAILPVIGAIFAWIALVIGVVGVVFGLLSNRTNGRNICILACVLAALRLALGFGLV